MIELKHIPFEILARAYIMSHARFTAEDFARRFGLGRGVAVAILMQRSDCGAVDLMQRNPVFFSTEVN